jgi:short-subunit dehydrogenase
MKVAQRVAVITGAAGGIGRGLSLALAKRGCNLALADINPTLLEQTCNEMRAHGVQVSSHILDVADRAAAAPFLAQVLAEHGRVDILINNAGVAVGGLFEQVSEQDFDWLMSINFSAVVRLTRVFLPALKSSDDACIVNLSSLFGLIAPPGQTAYCASKFAVRGFSNALRHELQDGPVNVLVVHPGGVATNIARSARRPEGVAPELAAQKLAETQKMLTMPPERAGEIIICAMEKRRARILVGKDAVLMSWLERLMPVRYWRLLAKSA